MLPLFLNVYLQATGVIRSRVERLEGRDRGQGTLEYVGMIIIAALIVVAVSTAFTGADLGGKVTGAITKVTSLGG